MDLKLKKYLHRLCDELEIDEKPEANKYKKYVFIFTETIQISIQEFDDHAFFQSRLSECPKKGREDLFIYLMEANLLGQGTGDNAIGLDEKERYLTLSLLMPYEIKYQLFKEQIEDFVNYVVYWREEVDAFKKKIEETIL